MKQTGRSGYLLAVDFEKAFDSLEWDYLWHALEAFGFPNEFINLLKMLYCDNVACVMNGGTTTKHFPVTRGAKQGDPPSGI